MVKNTAGKWLLLILAFIMSCLIWYTVITNDDPRIRVSLGNIEVELLNGEQLHEQGLAYYVEEHKSIKVKVTIVQEKGWLIKASDIRLTADLSSCIGEKCEYQIPVKAEILNNQQLIGNNYKLEESSITIRTEKLVEKEVPVVVNTEGAPEDNCSVGAAIPEESRIKVQVPKSKENLVTTAVSTLDISGRSADYEGEVHLQFVDEQGKPIDCEAEQIFPETDTMQVLIPIGMVKEVKIGKIAYSGICKEGYRCTGITSSLKKVQVIGPEESLKTLEKITIPPYEVDISEKEASFDLNFELEELLPEKIRLYQEEESQLKVSVVIEKLEQKTISLPAGQLVFHKLPSAYQATVENETIRVVVEALPKELEELKTEQIQISVDLKGYQPGVHQVPVDVKIVDNKVGYQILSSQKATIVISQSDM